MLHKLGASFAFLEHLIKVNYVKIRKESDVTCGGKRGKTRALLNSAEVTLSSPGRKWLNILNVHKVRHIFAKTDYFI